MLCWNRWKNPWMRTVLLVVWLAAAGAVIAGAVRIVSDHAIGRAPAGRRELRLLGIGTLVALLPLVLVLLFL